MSTHTAAPLRRSEARIYALYPLVVLGFVALFIRSVASGLDVAIIQRFAVTTLSIIVEALPFLLIGSVVSSLIHIYISESTLARVVPKSHVLGSLGASLMGFVFPLCECGIVPVVRRLVRKGVPLHVAITFMLAVPMVNPLVLISTWLAFYQYPLMVLYRGVFGLAASVIIGLVVAQLAERGVIDASLLTAPGDAEDAVHGAHEAHSHDHAIPSGGSRLRRIGSHVVHVVSHATEDFYDVGRYFFLGVLLSSLIQVLIPSQSLQSVGHSVVVSVVVMIIAAYVLSVCSEADAFIARTFMTQFSNGAMVAFLIFGPMMDLKNTLMLSTTFRGRFIVALIVIIAVISFVIGLLVNLLPGVFPLSTTIIGAAG